MRILLVLALLGLAASFYFAPDSFERRFWTVPEGALFDADPLVRAARGEEERSLGVAMEGYLDLTQSAAVDVEAVRGRFLTGLKLGAVAIGQQGLPQFVNEHVKIYLARRDEIDPDGFVLQEAVRTWINLRLGLPVQSAPHLFYSQAAVAIFLAARDDPRGHELLMEYVRRGPFYTQFFTYVRRSHPAWRAVRPLVKHYLEKGNLDGRLEAGVTLLDYNNLFGEGADLLEVHTENIRAAFSKCIERWGGRSRDRYFDQGAVALVLGLALLGGPAEQRALKNMPDVDFPEIVDFLRIARILAGVTPLEAYEIGSDRWNLLSSDAQDFYFRAAVQLFARLRRQVAAAAEGPQRERLAERLKAAQAVAEAGLVAGTKDVMIFCFQGLVCNDPFFESSLPPRMIEGRGPPSLYAASFTELQDPVAVLLPGMVSSEPDVAAIAAVTLLDIDAPPPIQGP
ncbi:MAG: hypothetical protein ACYTGV_11725, partial [Planctomycetota bacterium]